MCTAVSHVTSHHHIFPVFLPHCLHIRSARPYHTIPPPLRLVIGSQLCATLQTSI